MAEIGAIGRISPHLPPLSSNAAHADGANADLFSRMLTAAIGALADLQANADAKAQAFAAGELVDLHDVMIAQEQSSLAFQFGLQVRNKIVEAYQEVMRMTI
ncbi:MAG: flagellar hook-basal body complex protein FliE [Chloroflexota bacterium]|nr:flagellar hook-basal body complex protein FliE [Dehalococcoidia bacterium]MDW8254461.1 flagellar hook-basal body complex protein FliE [Chloroflexota bacterium]